MDWITLVVVVLAILAVVGVSILLRRWPVRGKQRPSAEDLKAVAEIKNKQAEAQALTDSVRNPYRW
jgi:hypothetical protein